MLLLQIASCSVSQSGSRDADEEELDIDEADDSLTGGPSSSAASGPASAAPPRKKKPTPPDVATVLREYLDSDKCTAEELRKGVSYLCEMLQVKLMFCVFGKMLQVKLMFASFLMLYINK